MKQYQHQISIPCQGRGMIDFTREVQRWVKDTGMVTGLLNLFVQHTSCSLMIQENADPDVLRDMENFMARLVPDGDPMFYHRAEGEDDMPAHIRMALTQISINIPVQNSKLALGTWQGIYLYEHRHHAMTRHVQLHLIGT